MTAFQWIFLISTAIIAYCYFIYPCAVVALARFFPKPVRKGAVAPLLNILIPAHNEENIIREKIENTLSLEYPADRREIFVISDGSTDRTEEIVRGYGARGVRLIAFPRRRGKVPALLDVVPLLKGEILVFSDASGMLRPNALAETVANFADPEVGCVCGYYRSPGLVRGGGTGELLYWDYEFAIKRAQSRWRTLFGATGAMYALRRELFAPPPPDTINDDFVIPTLVVLRGYRSVLEENAVVDDLDPRMGNFRSRIRVAAGNWQQLFYCRGLLSPARPALCWQFVSHKLIRMLVPLLLVAMSVSLAAMAPLPALFLFALAAFSACLPRAAGPAGPAARKFIAGNAASLYGMILFFARRSRLSWN